jgi:pullulanase/glycogen debranching enzyme
MYLSMPDLIRPNHVHIFRVSVRKCEWLQGDQPLRLPMQDLIMYEAHVRGFTADPSSRVASPGTYAGMTERLDYLQELGVTAIELLPIFEFNELEYYTPIPGTNLFRYNFWGYSTVAFFAPMARFSAQVRRHSLDNLLTAFRCVSTNLQVLASNTQCVHRFVFDHSIA